MAKVVITLEDQEDGVSVDIRSEPELPANLDDEEVQDSLSEAQLLAINILEWLEEEEEFDDDEE
jgi:hypothetical protein